MLLFLTAALALAPSIPAFTPLASRAASSRAASSPLRMTPDSYEDRWRERRCEALLRQRELSVGEIKTEIYEAKKKLLDLRLLQKQKMMQGKIQAHEFKHEKRWVNLLFTALAEKEEAGEVAPSGAPGFEAAPESADA